MFELIVNFFNKIKQNKENILFFIAVFLFCLLALGAGILIKDSKKSHKTPIQFENLDKMAR